MTSVSDVCRPKRLPSLVCVRPLGGATVFAMVVIGPWWIFHVMFSVVTLLHHTHPRVPWFRTRRESCFYAGQVQATVHVDPRVPFRALPEAQRRLETAFATDIIVERWSLASFVAVTRRCKLFDYDRRRWLDFGLRPTARTP